MFPAWTAAEAGGAALKSALLLSRFKLEALHPLTHEEIAERWYSQGLDEASLTTKARLLLDWLCILASGEDLAPLPYSLTELQRKFPKWSAAEMRQAAGCAAAAGFAALDRDTVILTDPRERQHDPG